MSIWFYSFMLINEFFTGDVAKVSIVLMSISCGTGGILYVVFSYLVNSNSMLLFLIMGILVFFNSFYLFFFKGPDNFKEAMSKNVKSFFSSIFHNFFRNSYFTHQICFMLRKKIFG